MALNKQFIHFQTKSAFNEQKENISDTSIAFIKETGEIYTHDKLYGSISVASSTANGLMPKEHYSIIDKESNNQFVTELSNNVSTTADKVYIQYKSRYFGNNLKYAKMCNILSATSTNAGVMSAADKVKLDSLSNYTLPTANSSTLGGIKIGSGLNIDSNGTVSVDNKLYILVNSLESVTTPDANKIYLVLNSSSTNETNSFTEYVWITSDTGGKWEKLGEASATVDLTPYAKTADVTSAIDAAKTELTSDIATAKSQAISEAKSETATAAQQLYRSKTSWANGGTITSETYYNILKGTQDSFTLPFDLNGFISGITANGNAQRYSGVMFAVSYANTPGQPKQRSDTLYLPFAAVNAEKGVVAFEDLQFHYTDLASTDVDVRYKVTPVPGSQIKLEKVEESANKPDTPTAAAKPPTFLIRGDGGDTLDSVAMEEFTLTPTQLIDGSVDCFYMRLPDSVKQQLSSLMSTLLKYQNPGSSAFSVAQKDPMDVLPRFMLCFYDGYLAYPFYVVKSDGESFILKGDIPTTSRDFVTWLVTVCPYYDQAVTFNRIK